MTDQPMTPARRLRNIIGGSAGNLVEWFDWYAYAAFTLYFAPVFFPDENPTAQLLSAAAVFAVGFLMRPIGAWIMGVYADRKGRKAGLTLSVSLMCAGSLIIGCAPGYAQIGIAAPILLLFARLLQGISVGGEYGSSATYLSEMATPKHRGFWSSFQYVTLISGQLLALLLLIVLQRTLSTEALGSWGWRIPFFVGALLAVVVFWLRRRLDETAAFKAEDVRTAPKSSALQLVMKHPKEALMVLGLTAGGTLAFYTYTTYLQKFLVNTSGFSKTTATEISAGALLIYMLLQPAVGALSDRIGRRPVMIAFGVLGVLCTVPIMSALAVTTNAYAAFALALTALVIVSGYTAINAVVKAELFPAHIRALGVALPYAIANALFGGTAEYVALWFKLEGAESRYFWYVTVMIGVSLLVFVFMRDTKHKTLITHE
ncbi:MFS transporter [Brevundimonas goettingensis]|uniref:Alpha-ketoglutarate permease n=1 Tax=Brevundimonas goettingensis TaxID=2774190 RepID=A0A975GVZ3_9CAUL|nr:MFS transporter [Brevundimonas goettingensis]QTC91992.1 MFS transporter [Brevundimonas goettingensis]